jgi:hypothetical protein
MQPFWNSLSVIAFVGGVLALFAPRVLVTLNQRFTKTLVSLDEFFLRYRYLMGVLLLIVGFLCLRLARLSG